MRVVNNTVAFARVQGAQAESVADERPVRKPTETCANCQMPIPDGSKFCVECGTLA